MDDIETRTIAKVKWRLIPFLMVCYFFAFLDRVNLGFAALEMNKDLGFTATIMGTGAGIFFLTYFLLEIPSNLALEKFGARKWIARIMFTWAILAGAMAFISNVNQFYIVRLLLGAAEAGFFPGIIFYITLWFPAEYRARIVGWFMVAVPVSSLIGAPVSGYLLGLDGVMGLRGWQWLYVLEAAPTIVLAVVTWFYLTDRPKEATWLSPEERDWLQKTLDREDAHRESLNKLSLLQALINPRVIGLSLVYFGIVVTLYGLGFFLPTIVKAFGLTNVQTGWVSAVPYLIGAVAMVLWGMQSDRSQERKWHAIIPCFISALGLALAAPTTDPYLKMAALSLSAIGTFAAFPVFWTLPTGYLSGAAAAGGIAMINAIGNLSGYFGPTIMGTMKDLTGTFETGLYLLAGFVALAGVIVLFLGHDHNLERAPKAR